MHSFQPRWLPRWGHRLLTTRYLDEQLSIVHFGQRIAENRERFRILVVDDKEFTPLSNLNRHNYWIQHVPDINSINVVAPFHIVLSDLTGVGIALNPNMQGAHLIAEIKKNYPEKVVIAYTGGGSSPLVERSIQVADHFLKKDADIEEWCEILDASINELANPSKVWQKIRHRLLNAGVSPYELALLEDTFVANVLSDQPIYEHELKQRLRGMRISADARAIVNSLISVQYSRSLDT
jgi:hypothetical protein